MGKGFDSIFQNRLSDALLNSWDIGTCLFPLLPPLSKHYTAHAGPNKLNLLCKVSHSGSPVNVEIDSNMFVNVHPCPGRGRTLFPWTQRTGESLEPGEETAVSQTRALKRARRSSLGAQWGKGPVLSLWRLGHCSGMGLFPNPGISACHGRGPPNKIH